MRCLDFVSQLMNADCGFSAQVFLPNVTLPPWKNYALIMVKTMMINYCHQIMQRDKNG